MVHVRCVCECGLELSVISDKNMQCSLVVTSHHDSQVLLGSDGGGPIQHLHVLSFWTLFNVRYSRN
jgi:hypothetical protein